MSDLIIRRGIQKKAALLDGPSFLEQFGILANAVIANKFPQLDNMKIAFQLILNNLDNSEACGAAVYLIGKSVVFVPAFFKNNKLKTGDMMFIANTQQFLPLSDPWLAWIKNKDIEDAGEVLPPDLVDAQGSTRGTTIKEIADPIIKAASVHLKGLLALLPDMQKGYDDSILDTTLTMGKKATDTMLSSLVSNPDFLNAALHFYDGNALDTFAKKAELMSQDIPTVELIMPLDKKAKELNADLLKALNRDGFFIRKIAAKDSPDVIRSKQLNGMFTAVAGPGKYQMLSADGEIKEMIVLQKRGYVDPAFPEEDACCSWSGPSRKSPGLDAADYMLKSGTTMEAVGLNGKLFSIPSGSMALSSDREPFSVDMLSKIGNSPDSIKCLGDGCDIVLPDGSVQKFGGYRFNKTSDGKGWSDGRYFVQLGTNDQQVTVIKTGTGMILPAKCRIIVPIYRNEDGTSKTVDRDETVKIEESKPNATFVPVTVGNLDAFLTEYTKKKYNKAKIYSDGQSYVLSGDKSSDSTPKSIKEAALALVEDYDLDPSIAKVMLKETLNGASYNNPKTSTYYISKSAGDEKYWEDANIGMNQVNNKEPSREFMQMPTVLEDPAQLLQAAVSAAQQGIKEVFDVTALKLLVRQNRFFDEINEDIPLFMRVLDSLCRKLFQFYWHTEKMEEKYGTVKLKALEESLKCTLDSLSELTIFFKLRTVDGSGVTGDASGLLMTGSML